MTDPTKKEYEAARDYQDIRYDPEMYKAAQQLGAWYNEVLNRISLLDKLNRLCSYDLEYPAACGKVGLNESVILRNEAVALSYKLAHMRQQIHNNDRNAEQCVRDYEAIPRKANRGAKKSRKALRPGNEASRKGT